MAMKHSLTNRELFYFTPPGKCILPARLSRLYFSCPRPLVSHFCPDRREDKSQGPHNFPMFNPFQ